ncbi:hypothetical protein [uncultured Anaerotruncus sp.]|uniref:hypothetical protein n=1 Tax=uncultured Anaerotruncus sp. TaxID=905011 RepID=UPI00280C0CA9|nr:hypothetical protein [uncultured Anaerotruncus sp.]
MTNNDDYKLAYCFLASKVSEVTEFLRRPLEGETAEQIKNSAAARTVQAVVLLEEAQRRSCEILCADKS